MTISKEEAEQDILSLVRPSGSGIHWSANYSTPLLPNFARERAIYDKAVTLAAENAALVKERDESGAEKKRLLKYAEITAEHYEKIEQGCDRLQEALEFYRDGFEIKVTKSGPIYQPTEKLLDDCGNKAKSVLEGK